MKKTVKKLVLSKETLRSLEVVTLNEVVGGTDTWSRICLPDSIHDVC